MADKNRHYLEQELIDLVSSMPGKLIELLDQSLDGLWYWDCEKPENEWYSPGFWRTLGYDSSNYDQKSSHWQSIIHPDDLEKALTNTVSSRMLIIRTIKPCAILGADGSTAWIRCRGYAIRDDDGKALRILGIHNDVTDACLRSCWRRSAV